MATTRGGAVTDPQGPAAGSDRVGRGGGWSGGARLSRSRAGPGWRVDILGFRLLRTE